MAEAWDINENTADPDEQQDMPHPDGRTDTVSDDGDGASETDEENEDGPDDRGLNRGRSGSTS